MSGTRGWMAQLGAGGGHRRHPDAARRPLRRALRRVRSKKALVVGLVVVAATATVVPLKVGGGRAHVAGATAAVPLVEETFTWGADGSGQLGDGTTQQADAVPAPLTVKGPTFRALAMGGLDTLGLTTAGTIYAWGADTFGQLGTGSPGAGSSVPVAVATPVGVTFSAVAAGSDDSLALSSTGVVYAWGGNAFGQLGDGSPTSSASPVALRAPTGVVFTAIAAGGYDSYALAATGAVYAWGANFYGQLGDGLTAPSATPVRVHAPAGVTFTGIAAGDGHALAVTSGGAVYGWGDNRSGQVGDGTNVNRRTPVAVDLPSGDQVSEVAAGSADSVALTTTGAVLVWGSGVLGELGNGGTTDSSVPVAPTLPGGVAFEDIAAGSESVYAVSDLGQGWAWGADLFGQLGGGTTAQTGQLIPQQLTLQGVPAGTLTAGIFAGPDTTSAALVTPRAQSLTFPAVGPQTYGVPPVTISPAATSGLRVTVTATGSCSASNSRVFILAVGSCSLTANQSGDLQYYAAAPVSITFTIAPAPLTVTPNDLSAEAGTPLPPLTYTVTGFKDGDTSAILSGSASCTTTATSSSAPGQYPITCTAGTLSAPNYVIVAGPTGNFTLTEALNGYAVFSADGSVWTEGPQTGPSVQNYGSLAGVVLDAPVVGGAFTPSRDGYWLVASDGGIFAFGGAAFDGSMGGRPLNKPIVGMAATPTGSGYWLVASDGGIFAFGDAGFFGSTGSLTLNKPIVGMVPTSDGQGYWLVASDGGIFAFGDAGFFGSTGGTPTTAAVVGMATTPDGQGYWLATADGNIYNFGDAGFEGSLRYVTLGAPIVSISGAPNGEGYLLAAADGGVFAFGSAAYYGRVMTPPTPVVGIT